MSVPHGILPFKLIADTSQSIVTSFAGLPLVVETVRAMKIPQLVNRHVKVKQRDSGKYTESDYVESFISLLASGGECLDDMERIRADRGLLKVGIGIPSSPAARFFLYAFHDKAMLKERPVKGAFIPAETEELKGLLRVQEGIVGRAMRGQSPCVATIDQDAVVIESNKREALPTYLGHDGYQPLMNYWAESDLVLADEFRDGNVPAAHDCYSSLRRSMEMLPDSVREVRFRADSAAYNHKLIDNLAEGMKIRGRHVRLRYAISADMTKELRGEIEELPEERWKPLRKITEKGLIEGGKEWAEVEYVPMKGKEISRCLAIRVRPSRGGLFKDGKKYHYYAVVTNFWEWNGERLLRWHREKCGTVEKVHDVMKNDLGGSVMPCGRFGANAAWWRLNCITYNVMSIMKRKALPQRWWSYRMKALRYWLIGVAGRLIRTGRQLSMRFCGSPDIVNIYAEARRKLFTLAKGA